MFRIGAMIGLGVTMGWLALVLLVVGVLWIRGISPGEAADGKLPTERHAATRWAAGADADSSPTRLIGYSPMACRCRRCRSASHFPRTSTLSA
ncbi:MAG: hypothetical protein QOF10_4047 [Kribbellaceae bacterium]|jgi:hypothetical protein|nr:hypothetical protein [Kribbellaceae bacterium]